MPKLIDLTRPITPGMPVYPGDSAFKSEIIATYSDDGFLTSRWSIVSHLGTHLDSPLHYVPRGKSFDQLPLETFYGPAAAISLVDELKDKKKPARITSEMLEKYHDAFEQEKRILIETGWENEYGQKHFFTSFPSLTVEAAHWIVNRRMMLLGFDTPSVSSIRAEDENTASEDAICHRILLRNTPPVLPLEGLVNLSELPKWPTKFILCCFPLKILGVDGSPTRAIAILNEP